MNQIDKESLSALLDNEADDLELRRVLKACEQDVELLQTWERYSLVQSALHEPATPVSSSLSEKIAAQIAVEATPEKSSQPAAKSNWQQGIARVAIAASVAVVFLFALDSNLSGGPDSVSTPALAQAATVEALNPIAPNTETQSDRLLADDGSNAVDPVARQRLQEYIESMTFDEEEPPRMEHIQDSPLFRLVNELQAKP